MIKKKKNLVMYLFVPRTRIPKLKKISSRKMLEHVSLSFNKKWNLEVCIRYRNNNVRMTSISYGIHGFVVKSAQCKCKWTY
jgi:hypothetical protein